LAARWKTARHAAGRRRAGLPDRAGEADDGALTVSLDGGSFGGVCSDEFVPMNRAADQLVAYAPPIPRTMRAEHCLCLPQVGTSNPGFSRDVSRRVADPTNHPEPYCRRHGAAAL